MKPVIWSHFDNRGPYTVWSDGGGTYVVKSPKLDIVLTTCAADYAAMKCKELNAEVANGAS